MMLRMLLDHNLAIHTYFSKDLKPKLFEKLGPITSKDYFEPAWMSSTYAIRQMDKYFRHFNPHAYYYKECAINARSPENEADNYERAFLDKLQASPKLTMNSKIRVLDGKPYFTVIRRGEAMEESCLRCHSTPDKAPRDMVRHYGPERSFHRKLDEAVQAISIRIPLSEAFSTATEFSSFLSGLLLLIFGGGFLFVWMGHKRLVIDPISSVRAQAEQIATDQQRLGETIPLPKVRELQGLVEAFNQMSVALRNSYDDLEQRVLERTNDLAMQRERLAVTLSSIGDGVIGTDTNGRITAMNREAEDLTGWKEAEALGRPLEEVFVIISEETREACENPVERVLKTGEIVGLAHSTLLIAKDGTERILADSGAPIRAEDGEVLGVVLVFRDATERVRAEEKLAKNEALLKEAQRVAHIGHWELEDPTGAPSWSEEIFHIFGLDPAEGEPPFEAHRDIIHAEDWDRFDHSVRTCSSEGQPFDIELRLLRPDGSIRWMNVKGEPRTNEKGDVVRLFGTAQDVTDMKRIELDLRNQKVLLQSMVEAIPGPVFFKDTSHVYLGCNTAFADFMGRKKLEITGKSVFEVAPKELAEVYRAQDQELFDNPGSQVYESSVTNADGSSRDVVFHKATFLDATGAVAGLIGVILDITERKRAEEAVRQSKETLETILANLPVMVGFIDRHGTHQYVNRCWQETLGWSLEEAQTRDILADLYPNPDYRDYVVDSIAKAEDRWGEFETLTRDGRVINTSWVNAPLPDGSSIGIGLDITDRKRTEEERENLRRQLFQAQKMEALGTLTGGIAHDFNNLLTIINGYTELMLLEMTEDDPLHPDLQTIFETGRKGAELVQRLLALSRNTEGNPEPLNLNEVVEQSVVLMKRTFPKTIEIDASLDNELSTVNADASQIRQVLMNICVNAKDAMPSGGRIGIRTKNIEVDEEHQRERLEGKTGPHVLMEISDTGPGMSSEIIERVFEPFFTTKGWDSNKGTGLGLPVAAGIIEQHGGWIACRTEEGKGTTFSVYVPAIGEESAVSEQKIEEPSPTGKKILLVDDEEFVRDVGRRILEVGDHQVVTASSGKEALDIYTREREDIGLVILDLMMPRMGGEECLYELVKIDPRVKVIISTGYSLDSEERRRLGRSAKGFVNKPYKVKELIQAVQLIL